MKRYALGRYVRVALPSQIWAVIVFAVTLGSYALNTLMVLFNLQGLNWIIHNLNIPNGGPYLSHSWFVTIILICYALVPLLNRYVHRLKWIHFLLLYLIGIVLELLNLNVFYFLLFSLSFFIAARKHDTTRIKTIWIAAALVAALGIRFTGHMYIDNTKLYNNYLTTFTQEIIAASILLIISKCVSKCKKRISLIVESAGFRFIENHSYSIYLVHYALIPLLYGRLPLLLATVCFLVITAVLATVLDFVSERAGKAMMNKGIS